MKFDEHEIWGAPVRAAEPAVEVPLEDAPTPPGSAGRLYRSSGSDAHPDAILALPRHRRHTQVQSIEHTQWASPAAPSAPIAISSRIPRPLAVDDAAIAEVLATPTPAAPATEDVAPAAGYTDWFRSPAPMAALAQMRSTGAVEVPTASRWSGLRESLSQRGVGSFMFVGLVFGLTTIVALVNAVAASALGLPTGIALVASTALGAWLINGESRWAAWVMPAYILIAVTLIAGQFSGNAPGASAIGQLMLVATALISLAPWLTVATILGAVLPAVHRRA